jgi:DNA-directed RNA polymerase specialized sigma24 family protein
MLDARITAMISDPELVKSIRATLRRKGVPKTERPDLLQESFMAAFLCRNLPEDDIAARQYLFGIVRKKAQKLLRDRRRRNHEALEAEPCEDNGPTPFEVRDLLGKIVAAVPENRWESFLWFTRVTFGESLADIAREEGVEYAAAHARYARIRADLKRWAAQIAAGVAALLVVVGAYLLRSRREPIAPDHTVHPAPVVVPLSRPAAPISEEDRRDAADLRAQAAQDCAARRWIECQRDLDEAKVRDPAGETDPAVIELRRQLQETRDRSFPGRKPAWP